MPDRPPIPPLRKLAEDYAASLHPGSTIDEATDGPYIAPFRQLLPGLLAKRGLMVKEIPGGFVVARAPWIERVAKVAAAVMAPPPPPPPQFQCTTCGQSWFDCEHGSNFCLLVTSWSDYERFVSSRPSTDERRPRA